MTEKRNEDYSVIGKLMWLPLLSAPVRYTMPRVLLPAAIACLMVAVFAGVHSGLKVGLCVWFVSGWVASFGYKSDDGL